MNVINRYALAGLVLWVGACAPMDQKETQTLAPAPRTPPPEYTAESITFIHMNDTYRIDDVEEHSFGGLARVATVVSDLQAAGERVWIVHAGDFLFPSLESDHFDGLQMVDALNYLNELAPVIVVPGNHEFDKDRERFRAAVARSKFLWAGSNIDFRTGDPSIDSRMIKEHVIPVAGRKIGLFALTLVDDEIREDATYVEISPDYVKQAQAAIVRLNGEGVDALIGLTHLESTDDRDIADLKSTDGKLAWVATGHEHVSFGAPASAGSALITRGGSNARSVWRVRLSFDAAGRPLVDGKEIVLDSTVAPLADYQEKVLKPYREKLLARLPFLEYQIGVAAVDLDGREESIRTKETALGNYIADQLKEAFPDLQPDLGVIHGGNIRIDDVIKGDITFEDIWRTFGFDTPYRYLRISGRDLRQRVFANAYSSNDPAPGRFLQVSAGVRVCYDPGKDADPRIIQLQKQLPDGSWREIQDKEEVALVAPAYLFQGGDDYKFGQRARFASPATGKAKFLIMGAILSAYEKGEKIGAAIDPANPRIARLQGGQAACF